MTTKITTGKQAKAALKRIMKLTGWTLNRAATNIGITRPALAKIYDGPTKNPRQDHMDRIAEVLAEVEAMK